MVVVVVVVVLAVLFATGVLQFPSSGGSYGTAADSATAQQAMNPIVDNYSGGPWTPIVMYGIGSTSAVSGPSSEFAQGFFSCASSSPINPPATVTIPAVRGNSGGNATFWIGYYLSGSTTLMAIWSGGTVSLMYEGSGCTGIPADGTQDLSLATVNSSEAVAVASQNGGSEWLGNHSLAATLLLLSGATHEPMIWGVEYSSCSFSAPGGSGSEFIADIDAQGGGLIAAQTIGVQC